VKNLLATLGGKLQRLLADILESIGGLAVPARQAAQVVQLSQGLQVQLQ
jgi:hypothetical protein